MPMPDETLAFIAELADELAEMADDQGHQLLGYLLRMAVQEAQRSNRSEVDFPDPGKRISYH